MAEFQTQHLRDPSTAQQMCFRPRPRYCASQRIKTCVNVKVFVRSVGDEWLPLVPGKLNQLLYLLCSGD